MFFLVGILVLVSPVQHKLRQMLRMLQASCMTQLGAVLALLAHRVAGMSAGLSRTDPEQKMVLVHPTCTVSVFQGGRERALQRMGIPSFSSCTSYPLSINPWEWLGVLTSLITFLRLLKGQRGGREKRFVRILQTQMYEVIIPSAGGISTGRMSIPELLHWDLQGSYCSV